MRIGASLSVVNEAIWILKRSGVVNREYDYVIIDALVQAQLSLKLSRIANMAILYNLINKLNGLF